MIRGEDFAFGEFFAFFRRFEGNFSGRKALELPNCLIPGSCMHEPSAKADKLLSIKVELTALLNLFYNYGEVAFTLPVFEPQKEGENMSLEAIKQVTQTEAESKQRKAEAIAAARKLVSDAEQAGKEHLKKACAEAEAGAKELMVQAEERSRVRSAEIAAQSKKDCAALCSAAEDRLDQAAALIVRRVVSS